MNSFESECTETGWLLRRRMGRILALTEEIQAYVKNTKRMLNAALALSKSANVSNSLPTPGDYEELEALLKEDTAGNCLEAPQDIAESSRMELSAPKRARDKEPSNNEDQKAKRRKIHGLDSSATSLANPAGSSQGEQTESTTERLKRREKKKHLAIKIHFRFRAMEILKHATWDESGSMGTISIERLVQLNIDLKNPLKSMKKRMTSRAFIFHLSEPRFLTFSHPEINSENWKVKVFAFR